ncbi:TonB-dependent receptor [Puteibacter caeruleilacunae]|nr:TonB-dependent receptor [Puteibacter caeruleilacunae]
MGKNRSIYWQMRTGLSANKLKLSLMLMCWSLFQLSAAADTFSDKGISGKDNLAGSEIAQKSKRSISGIVKDEQGMPVPGATVFIKGTTMGTITQSDGTYHLEVPETGGVLVFSFIGMETQEITIGATALINCVLKSSEMVIDEVSVIAYGTQKKVTITGAISSMDTKELVKMPVASVSNMLAGNVTGVSAVQYSGQPGADDAAIYVRGEANPLVLVDGVERPFSQIDPNVIADITVLKDASSTAVFGVRGANGVILISTRRGQEGAAQISINSSFGAQVPTSLGDYVNAEDFMTYVNEANKNDGQSLTYSKETLEQYKNPDRNKLLYPDTDWQDMFYDDYASQQQHNVNVSGGTKRVKYFTSIGMFNQNGIFNGNEKLEKNGSFTFRRYNLRSNLDFDITKTTFMSMNIGARLENRNEPNAYKPGEFFGIFKEANPLGGAGIIDGKVIVGNSKLYVPNGRDAYTFVGRGATSRSKNVLNLDFKLKQKLDFITKGLDISLKGSYNSQYEQSKTFKTARPRYTPWKRKDIPWLQDVPYTQEEGEEVILIKSGDDGKTEFGHSIGRGRDFYSELALNYKRSFGGHNVSGLLMYNAKRLYYPNGDRVTPDLPAGYVGLVGRATYDYDTRYLVDLSVGYNGSENFHPDRRYGVFPSASLGWVISEESFLKDNSTINYLKLRASYGIVGRDKRYNDYRYRFGYVPNSWTFGGGYLFGDVSGGTWYGGVNEGKIHDEDTTWETAHKQNYGIDMRFIDSKLSVYIDYFFEKRDNILIARNTFPVFTAYTPPEVNLGKREIKGMEFNVGWKSNINKFSYKVSINGSYAKRIITFKDEVPNPDNPWTLSTGYEEGQPFGLDFIGFYREGMKNNNGVDARVVQPSISEGDCVFADINGDGTIDANDRIAIGHTNNPRFNGGINLSCDYKNISLSMQWNGATGVSRVLAGTYREPLGPTGDRSLMQEQFDNRWTPETAETATLPRASMSSLTNNSQVSDLWIRDASYIRLKNIRLGYTIQSHAVKRLGVKKLDVFVAGQNILTFDKLKILDPESRTTALNPGYPIMAVYNIGVNLSF